MVLNELYKVPGVQKQKCLHRVKLLEKKNWPSLIMKPRNVGHARHKR